MKSNTLLESVLLLYLYRYCKSKITARIMVFFSFENPYYLQLVRGSVDFEDYFVKPK